MQKEGNAKAPKSPAKAKPAFSVDSLDASKPLSEAASCLEFLLLSFCQHFSLKPKQAAGLLTQEGKYLAYVLSRGLKGRFEPILAWYQALHGSYPAILNLMQKEETSGSVAFILSAVHGGLRSRSLETTQWTCRILVLLGSELQNQGLLRPAWEVSSRQWFVHTGLEACLAACGRYGPDIKGQVVTVLVQFGHGNFLELFTVQLRNHLSPTSAYLVTMTEFLPSLCELRSGKQELVSEGVVDYWLDRGVKEWAESKSSPELRSAAITLLCALWMRFPGKVEAQDKLAGEVLTALTRATRDSKSNLIQFSTIAKMFGLLDHFSLDRNAYAPILYKTLTFALVENYDKHLLREFILDNFSRTFGREADMPVGILLDPYLKQLQVADISVCNLADLNFFLIISKHPRLTVKNAVQVLDILAKYAVAMPIYLRPVQHMIKIITTRYGDNTALQEFLYQSVRLLVEGITGNEDEEGTVKERFVEVVIQIAPAEVKTRVMKLLVGIYKEQGKRGKANETVLRLLAPLTDVKKLGLENPDSEGNRSFGRQSSESPAKKRAPRQVTSRVFAYMDQAKHKPSPLPAKSVLIPPQIPEKKDKKQRTFKRQFELKRISTDSSMRNASFEVPKPSFSYDLSEESVEDQEGVWAVMKKYTRVLKLLFQKYSSSGYRVKDSVTFDQQKEKLAVITETEMMKLLKDQGVAPRYVTKEVVSGLYRKRQGLDVEAYQEMMVQVAVYVFSKAPKDLSAYPPAVSVKAFFELLRSASADKGLPLRLFDEPDPGAGDRDLCRKLNQALQKDPNTELPEGYRKVVDYDLQVSYTIPRTVRVPRSYKVALGVLDDILSEQLGVHILEPQFRFKPVPHAQGVLVKATKLMLPVLMDPDIKYQASLLVRDYPSDILVECAQTLDDLVYTVEMRSPVILSRKHNKAVPNQIMKNKEAKEKEAEEMKEKAEKRRQLRRQVVEETLQLKKKTQAKQKRRERRKVKRAEKEKLEILQQREEERRRYRENKERELRAWYQEKQAKEQAQIAHTVKMQEEKIEARSKLRQQFLSKQKQQLAGFAQEMAEKRALELQKENEELKKEEQAKIRQKQQALRAVQQHRRQRDFSQSLHSSLQTSINKPEVQLLLTDYSKSLETLFTHYSKAAARLDRDPLLAVSVLRLPGFKRMCQQLGLIPRLLGNEEVAVVFTRQAKGETEVEGVMGLTFDRFKQAFAELAVLTRTTVKEIKGAAPPRDDFDQKDLKEFFDHLEITANPKATVALINRIAKPGSEVQSETRSPILESESSKK